MKKFLALSFAALTALSAASLDEIKKAGVIKIATEGVYKPYSYHDENNALVGYDVEIARAVAEKIGVKVQFIEAPWDALLASFDAGKSDAMFNQVTIKDERKKKYDFSTPYTAVYPAVVVKEDNESIKSKADVKGKKGASSATSVYGTTLSEWGAQVQTVSGFNQAVELVLSGRAELLMNDDVTFYDFIKNKKVPLKIAFKGQEPMLSAAIVAKGNTELLSAINAALDELFKDGTIAKISQKYFGKDISK